MATHERRCIYCRVVTTGREGLAHVFPEAVIQNSWTLAPGAVCDHCNNYCSELDSTLVQYPPVAALAQFFALPGKQGIYRQVVGGIALTVRDDGKHDLGMTAFDPVYRINAEGKNTARVTLRPPPKFDLLKFRRALHHIAMNAIAAIAGETYVLGSEFDPLRKYVRNPRRGDAWTFAEAMVPSREHIRLGVRWPHENDPNFASVDLGLIVTVVGLHPDQDFAEIARTGFSVVDSTVIEVADFGLTHVAQ
jgi:hypothetical protein